MKRILLFFSFHTAGCFCSLPNLKRRTKEREREKPEILRPCQSRNAVWAVRMRNFPKKCNSEWLGQIPGERINLLLPKNKWKCTYWNYDHQELIFLRTKMPQIENKVFPSSENISSYDKKGVHSSLIVSFNLKNMRKCIIEKMVQLLSSRLVPVKGNNIVSHWRFFKKVTKEFLWDGKNDGVETN